MTLSQQLAGGRLVVGVAALTAPRIMSRMFGFPSNHDNATGRAMGRLFGVREIVVGTLGLRFADDPRIAGEMRRLQAWVDAGDAAAMGIALAKRDGIDRAALVTLVVALGACGSWVYLARSAQDGPQ